MQIACEKVCGSIEAEWCICALIKSVIIGSGIKKTQLNKGIWKYNLPNGDIFVGLIVLKV